MGGGVSTSTTGDGKSQFTENDLKHMCRAHAHNQFIFETVFQSDLLFVSLQDPNQETISAEEWTILIENSAEQEILKLYLKYSTSGEMNQHQFLQFNKDLKFLSKHYYTKKTALSFFQQYSYTSVFSPSSSPLSTAHLSHLHSHHHNKDTTTDNDNEKMINYSILRFKIFPLMTKIKNLSLSDLIIRLSRIEPDDLLNSTEITYTPSSSSALESHESDWKSKKIFAALQIQKIHRYRSAKLETEKLKKLRQIEALGPSVSSTSSTSISTLITPMTIEFEDKCLHLFQRYSGVNHEMNLHEFLKLCHDTTLIPYDGHQKIDLTTREAKYIFQCCVAKYFDPDSNSYRAGVVHGKRILYEVYRNDVLPALAEWKEMSYEEIFCLVSSVATVEQARRIYMRESGGPEIVSLLSSQTPRADAS
jgi:hypothetical protein